jgi:penicillin-binding protein 1A
MSEKTAKDNEADIKRKEQEKAALEEETAKKLAEIRAQQELEKAEQEKIRLNMQKEYEEMLAKMKAEINAKKDDEEAKREAEEREAKMRLEMEFKLEQDKLNAQK